MFCRCIGGEVSQKQIGMAASRCNRQKKTQKYPMGSKSIGIHGAFIVLTRNWTGDPSPANKKRDSLSTVSLVGEAGLESVLCQPTCDRSTGKGRYASPTPSTTRRPDDHKALLQILQKPAAIPLWVTMPPRFRFRLAKGMARQYFYHLSILNYLLSGNQSACLL